MENIKFSIVKQTVVILNLWSPVQYDLMCFMLMFSLTFFYGIDHRVILKKNK